AAQAEEAADAVGDGAALGAAVGRLDRGVGLAGVLELRLAAADDAAYFLHYLRARRQQLLERGAVQAVALDVGLGHHRRAARLAREQRRLAEEFAGMHRAYRLGRAARRLVKHLRLAEGEDVQPVRLVALLGDDVAARERRVLQPLGDVGL